MVDIKLSAAHQVSLWRGERHVASCFEAFQMAMDGSRGEMRTEANHARATAFVGNGAFLLGLPGVAFWAVRSTTLMQRTLMHGESRAGRRLEARHARGDPFSLSNARTRQARGAPRSPCPDRDRGSLGITVPGFLPRGTGLQIPNDLAGSSDGIG